MKEPGARNDRDGGSSLTNALVGMAPGVERYITGDTLAAAFVVLGFALVWLVAARMLRGRLTLILPACVACGAGLRSHNGLPQRCPECGQKLTTPNTVAWAAWSRASGGRRCGAWAIVLTALVALPASYPLVSERLNDWLRAPPPAPGPSVRVDHAMALAASATGPARRRARNRLAQEAVNAARNAEAGRVPITLPVRALVALRALDEAIAADQSRWGGPIFPIPPEEFEGERALQAETTMEVMDEPSVTLVWSAIESVVAAMLADPQYTEREMVEVLRHVAPRPVFRLSQRATQRGGCIYVMTSLPAMYVHERDAAGFSGGSTVRLVTQIDEVRRDGRSVASVPMLARRSGEVDVGALNEASDVELAWSMRASVRGGPDRIIHHGVATVRLMRYPGSPDAQATDPPARSPWEGAPCEATILSLGERWDVRVWIDCQPPRDEIPDADPRLAGGELLPLAAGSWRLLVDGVPIGVEGVIPPMRPRPMTIAAIVAPLPEGLPHTPQQLTVEFLPLTPDALSQARRRTLGEPIDQRLTRLSCVPRVVASHAPRYLLTPPSWWEEREERLSMRLLAVRPRRIEGVAVPP